VLADIGAAEAQVTLVTTATDEDNGTTNPATGTGTSLREAIADRSGHADIIRFDPAVFDGQPADVIRLTVASDFRQQIRIARSLSVDARNLPSGVTLSGDSDNDGPDSTEDTSIFQIYSGRTVGLHGLTLQHGNGDDRGGGGILNVGTLTLTQCILSGNHADNASGGGILNVGALTMTQCILSGNHADNSNSGGGGILSQGKLTMTQCTLSGNHADNAFGGGGIFNTASTWLTHCTLAGNTATSGRGGGIHNNSGRTTLTHCTVSGNTAAANWGSGVACYANNPTIEIVVVNSIISGNNGSDVDHIAGSGTNPFTSLGGNLIGTGNATGDFSVAGDILNATPQLAALASNGGPTETMALLPGSPALGAASGSTATTDQRGFPIVGTADIGAYESQGSTVTLTSSDNPSTTGTSITFTATVNELDPQTITPTGTVTFRADGNDLGSPVTLNASGIATLTTSTLAAGTPAITATYSGDALLLASTSNTINQTVLDLSVGNANDSGAFSLRQALANAAAHPGPDTITLTSTQTLTLTSELVVNDSGGVTIDASGLSNGFTISGGGTSRLMTISAGTNATLRCLTLTGGNGSGAAFPGYGGAVFCYQGTLTVERCTLAGNAAGSGGGALANYQGTVTLNQCTLSGNTGGGGGGAIFNRGTMRLSHCTVSGNSTSPNGAIYNYLNPLVLEHCIVALNNLGSTSGPEVVNFNGTITQSGASLTSSIDPLLAPLGNYGGPTQTMPPLPGSPALDQATVRNPALTTDQRGQPRPIGLRPDLGAVEGSVIIVTTPADELDAPGSPGAGVSLREAIRDVETGGTIVFDRAVFNSTTTNTLTLTKGPLNPQRNCTLNGSLNPGGITIKYAPSITSQPLPLSVISGADANFTITVTNLSGGVAYQWRKNGIDIPGQTAAALALTNVQEADEAVYDVRLSQDMPPGNVSQSNCWLAAFAATSQPASLVVDGATVTIQRSPSSARQRPHP